mgnify:CR=1 FL=1
MTSPLNRGGRAMPQSPISLRLMQVWHCHIPNVLCNIVDGGIEATVTGLHMHMVTARVMRGDNYIQNIRATLQIDALLTNACVREVHHLRGFKRLKNAARHSRRNQQVWCFCTCRKYFFTSDVVLQLHRELMMLVSLR